ncbi:MAG TPA: hypothetical protein VHJ37_00825 [Thermoleophilaceae bacterium]|jgi:hypothetical protein|nr:hypothetical protein [Thermoleophilaceae bacterium]
MSLARPLRRTTVLALGCLAGALAGGAPAGAVSLNDPEGDARCFFKPRGKHIQVGLTAMPSNYPFFGNPAGGPFVYYELTIELREMYGTKWKRFPPKLARTGGFDAQEPPSAYSWSVYGWFYGSRIYTKKAFRALRRLKGTAQLRLKDAGSDAVYAKTKPVRFSWVKDSSTGACYLQAAPQLPLGNG